MLSYGFADAEHREWAVREIVEPQPARAGRTILNVFSLELWLEMLGHCSPMDIVCLRRVCSSSRNIIDSNPLAWAAARRNTGNVPPPPNPDMPEWQWAVVVFTGPLDAARKVVPAWAESYTVQWQAAHQGNVAKFDEMLNEVKPLSSGAAKIRIREYMRSPSLQRALRVHRRDLRIMTSATWRDLLPTIQKEVGLIASCDMSRVPAGFRYAPDDRVVCPECHPRPDALFPYIHAISGARKRRAWFTEHTVCVVDLARHYWDAHPHIDVYAVPEVELYTRCLICDSQPYESTSSICKLRTAFTESGLNVHNRGFHGVVNPAPEGPWFASLELAR
ncbi:hypothetical protein K523DRAFT_422024 [Schizophyllum commune Tattone D]|nr:hypothetical protein K523DRAFT_422024 [Schizophyllum commune Tattone D]